MKTRVFNLLKRQKSRAYKLQRLAVAVLFLVTAILPAVGPSIEHILATHMGTHLLILWDGGAAPAGWSIVSAYDGRYPRGESPANVLQTGGGGTHAPIASLSHSNLAATGTNGGFTPFSDNAPSGHVHGFSAALGVGNASNNDEPEYRSLKLIQYDAGIPTDIPAGGIVFFDDDPGLPDSGWTRVSAQDGRFVKVDSSVGTGGSNSHTHSLTWPSLTAASGLIQSGNSAGTGSPAGHTHTAPATPAATGSVSTLPPYVEPLMAKADSTMLIPIGMLGMFDGDLGGSNGFTVRSGSGGVFHQQFLRPAAAFNGTSQGFATHTHADETSGATGGSGATGSNVVAGNTNAPHSHTITAQFNSVENLPEYFNVVIAERTGASMLLFWDGGAAPAGWSIFSEADGRFIRGDSVGNYGQTGGQNDHTHTINSVTHGSPATISSLGSGSTPSINTHTHPVPSATAATATNGNTPAYKNLQLISYDAGIPNIIPEDSIALFDDTPGIPGNWTRLTAYDDKTVRIDSTAGGEGGSDTHTHNISFMGNLGNSSGTATRSCTIFICNQEVAAGVHTHTVPSSSVSDASPNLPPYVETLLARADDDTPTLSVGLTAMFDGDPGGGWVVRSDPGEPFHQRLVRGGPDYTTALGSVGHTHTGGSVTSGPASATIARDNLAGFVVLAAPTHTHLVTPNFSPYASDPNYTGNNEYFLPPYFNVVIAEKVNFILEDYRWFVDSDDEDVTDPWSSVDIAENTAISSLPPINDPPGSGRELRLRIQIRIAGNNLASNAVELKLQYKAGTDFTCHTDTWADVGVGGGGSVWRYASSSVDDGEDLTQSRFAAPSTVLQTYIKSASSGTNPNPATLGDSIEYDFHIQHNGALDATKYSFRVLESSGILLSEYEVCPTLDTSPGTDNFLRHGNFFDNSGERGFFWAD